MSTTTITRAAVGHTCIHQGEPGADLCHQAASVDVIDGATVRPYCPEHAPTMTYRVAVTDESGTVLDSWEVELVPVGTEVRQARAVLATALDLMRAGAL